MRNNRGARSWRVGSVAAGMAMASVFALFGAPGARAGEGPAEGPIIPPHAASVLPGRTLALFVVEDISRTREALKGTSAGLLWAEKEVQDFVAPLRPKVRELLSKAEARAGLDLADFGAAFRGSVALAFVDLKVEQGARPVPEIALVADIADRAAAGRLLARLGEAVIARGRAEFKTWDLGALSFGRIIGPRGEVEINYVLTGGALYATLSRDGSLLEGIIAAAMDAAAAGSLADDPDFLKAVERAGLERDLFAFLHVGRAAEKVFEIAAQGEPADAVALARSVFAATGLDELRSVSLSCAVDAPGFRSQIFAHAPAPRRGVFGLISEEPVDRSLAGLCPTDGLGFVAWRFRPEMLLPFVKTFVATAQPGAEAQIDQGLAAAALFGIDLQRQVLAGLGGEGTLFLTSAELGGLLPFSKIVGLAAVLRVADPEAFAPVFEMAKAMASNALEMKGLALKAEEGPGGAGIDYVALPLGFSPAVSMSGGYLVMAPTKEAVAEVLGRLQAPGAGGLVDERACKEVIERVGVKPGFLVGYSRAARPEDVMLARALAPYAVGALYAASHEPGAPKALRELIGAISLPVMPTADILTKHALPSGVVGWTDEDGIGLTSWGPGPGVAALVPAAAAFTGAAGYAGLRASRRAARRARRFPRPRPRPPVEVDPAPVEQW